MKCLIIRRAPGVCVRVREWEPAQLERRWASRRLLQTSLDRRLTSYPPYLPPSPSTLSSTTLLPSNRGDNSSIPPGSRHYHYLITRPFPWPPLTFTLLAWWDLAVIMVFSLIKSLTRIVWKSFQFSPHFQYLELFSNSCIPAQLHSMVYRPKL